MSLWFADSKIACSHSTITPFKHLSHFKWCMFSTNVLVCWCVCACACVSFTRAIRNNGTVWLIFRKIDTWIWHSSSHIFAFAQNAISMTQSAKAIETHSVVGNICDGNSSNNKNSNSNIVWRQQRRQATKRNIVNWLVCTQYNWLKHT